MNNKAFTLLEVLAAIFLVTIGIFGAFVVVQQVISYSSVSSDRLVAAYLAQEGIELVRNIRDGNWLEQEPWYCGFYGSCPPWSDVNCQPPTNCCEGDPKFTDTPPFHFPLYSLSPCDYNTLRYLNIDNEGFYSYSINEPYTPTKFKRKITISNPEDLDEDGEIDKMTVSVKVLWQERGRLHSVTAQENLYNWR